MLETMMRTSPVAFGLCIAVSVPAVCVGVGLLFERSVGWAVSSPARHRLIVALVAGAYAVLAAISVALEGVGPQSWLNIALAVVWGAGACWYVLGPGRRAL
jgi:hypothetical protein